MQNAHYRMEERSNKNVNKQMYISMQCLCRLSLCIFPFKHSFENFFQKKTFRYSNISSMSNKIIGFFDLAFLCKRKQNT